MNYRTIYIAVITILLLSLSILIYINYFVPTYTILVNKSEQKLRMLDSHGNVVFSCYVSTGKNPGQKIISGDMKTPEGIFEITEILDLNNWYDDAGNGKIEVGGPYGPYFMRMYVPGHTGIAIHGTYKPHMLGKRDSRGCIRVSNDNIRYIVSKCKVGTKVVVLPSDEDLSVNNKIDSILNMHDMKDLDYISIVKSSPKSHIIHPFFN